jgi:hypothetical protein
MDRTNNRLAIAALSIAASVAGCVPQYQERNLTGDQERAIMQKCQAEAWKAYPELGLVKKRGLASEECFERLDN